MPDRYLASRGGGGRGTGIQPSPLPAIRSLARFYAGVGVEPLAIRLVGASSRREGARAEGARGELALRSQIIIIPQLSKRRSHPPSSLEKRLRWITATLKLNNTDAAIFKLVVRAALFYRSKRLPTLQALRKRLRTKSPSMRSACYWDSRSGMSVSASGAAAPCCNLVSSRTGTVAIMCRPQPS